MADFRSANCLREVSAAQQATKPLCLAHESDPQKNGAPLEDLRAACPAAHSSYIFDGAPILPWLRQYDFQLVTLIAIAEVLLLHTPEYEREVGLKLQHRNDIRYRPLVLGKPVMLYAARSNSGAADVAAQLQREANTIRRRASSVMSCRSAPSLRGAQKLASAPSSAPHARSRRVSAEASVESQMAVKPLALDWTDEEPTSFAAGIVTHFLIYLNDATFASDALAAEVRRAMAAGVPLCLVHENDPAAGAMPFDAFFRDTPADLVADGIYKSLATAWHPGEYRLTSVKLVLTALGAQRHRKRSLPLHPRLLWYELRACWSARHKPMADHGGELLLTDCSTHSPSAKSQSPSPSPSSARAP